jgi:hypothetical protein
MARDRYRQLAFDGQINVSAKFETDRDLIEMRKMYPEVRVVISLNCLQRFFEVFNEGFQKYIEGDWGKARQIFETVEEHKQMVDYPTRNLL